MRFEAALKVVGDPGIKKIPLTKKNVNVPHQEKPPPNRQVERGILTNKRCLGKLDDVCGLFTLGALGDIKRNQLTLG